MNAFRLVSLCTRTELKIKYISTLRYKKTKNFKGVFFFILKFGWNSKHHDENILYAIVGSIDL